MKKQLKDRWFGTIITVIAAGILVSSLLDRGRAMGRLLPAGSPMPGLSGVLADGSDFFMGEGNSAGMVVLLDFWTTWCPACVRGMSSLEELEKRFEGEPFIVLTVNMDDAATRDQQAKIVHEFMNRHELDLSVLLDDGRHQRAYNAYTLPTYYVVNKDGTIRRGWTGMVMERTLRREIERALSEGADK